MALRKEADGFIYYQFDRQYRFTDWDTAYRWLSQYNMLKRAA